MPPASGIYRPGRANVTFHLTKLLIILRARIHPRINTAPNHIRLVRIYESFQLNLNSLPINTIERTKIPINYAKITESLKLISSAAFVHSQSVHANRQFDG